MILAGGTLPIRWWLVRRRAALHMMLVAGCLGLLSGVALGAPPATKAARALYLDHLSKGRDAEALALLGTVIGVDEPGNCGARPLHEAAYTQRRTVVEALLKRGANPNAARCNGWTPIMDASGSINSGADIVSMLIAKGARLDAQRFDGKTALHLATEQWNRTVVLMLLDAKADPNLRDTSGRTPLFYARDGATARMLVDAGADFSLRDKQGRAPYDVVRETEVERMGDGPLRDAASDYLKSIGAPSR